LVAVRERNEAEAARLVAIREREEADTAKLLAIRELAEAEQAIQAASDAHVLAANLAQQAQVRRDGQIRPSSYSSAVVDIVCIIDLYLACICIVDL
jgi:hypothetical protein